MTRTSASGGGRKHYWRMLRSPLDEQDLGSVSEVSVVANRVHLTPIQIPVRMTISHIGFYNGSLFAGRCIVGIYGQTDDSPSDEALLIDSGSLLIGGGTFTKKEFALTSNYSLTPGLYFSAIVFNHTGQRFYAPMSPIQDGGVLQMYDFGASAFELPDPLGTVAQVGDPCVTYFVVASVP